MPENLSVPTTSCPVANQVYDTWLGSGDVDCTWIVVGIEEGGTGAQIDAHLSIDYWCQMGHPQLTDWRHKQLYYLMSQKCNSHTDIVGDLSKDCSCGSIRSYHWAVTQYVHCFEHQQHPNSDQRCQIMRNRFGRSSSVLTQLSLSGLRSCADQLVSPHNIITTLEMYPLSVKSTRKELFTELYGGFGSKRDYKRLCQVRRYPKILDWVLGRICNATNPPNVLIVGKDDQQKRLFRDLSNNEGQPNCYKVRTQANVPENSSISILERASDSKKAAVVQVSQPSQSIRGGENAQKDYYASVADIARKALMEA